jgi:hypothetical protein
MSEGADSGLELAARRLELALAGLEARLQRRADLGGSAFADDRARLAAELDAARARERNLERMAEEASAALGRAATEVRAALNADLTGA